MAFAIGAMHSVASMQRHGGAIVVVVGGALQNHNGFAIARVDMVA